MGRLTDKPIQSLPDTAFDRLSGEDDRSLMARLNTLVHKSTWHCKPTDYELSTIEQRVYGIMDEPRMFQDGILVRERFTCGFCHQRASLLVQSLVANDIDAAVFGLNGHVVVRAELPDEILYFDPDYGVGPINGSTESILNSYEPMPYGNPQSILAMYQSTNDNAYYSKERLNYEISAQRRLFQEADQIALDKALTSLSFLLLALVLGTCSLVLFRRRSEIERRRHVF